MPPKGPATQTPSTATRPTQRRGRAPVADKEAPHGRDESGNPKAPYGHLPSGKVRRYPERKTAALDLSVLAAPKDVTADVGEAVRPARARSEQQQAMDTVVQGKHAEWVKAGRPNDWKELPKARYDVPPEQEEDLKFLIGKSAQFLGVRVRFGSTVRTREGLSVVVFAVMDKVKQTKRTAQSAP